MKQKVGKGTRDGWNGWVRPSHRGKVWGDLVSKKGGGNGGGEVNDRVRYRIWGGGEDGGGAHGGTGWGGCATH